MARDIKDRTLALAGVFQAVFLVQQIARKGQADPLLLENAIQSLLVTDPERTEDVYGSTGNLRRGLNLLVDQLGPDPAKRDLELTRYFIALIQIERKLARRSRLLQDIATGLKRAQTQVNHFSLLHDNVMAGLADTYINTISTLSPRVMVSGEHGHLSNPDIANRVRALLLAGIRSAVLWRQCGGRRLQLIFKRKPLLEEARRLLSWLGAEETQT